MIGKLMGAVLAAGVAVMAGVQPAAAATTAVCAAQKSTADRINDAVAPVTDFVSGLIFYPIPVIPAEDRSTASVQIDPARLSDSDTLTVSRGGEEATFEFDSDGATCPNYIRAPIETTVEETARAVQTLMADRSIAVQDLQITDRGAFLYFEEDTAASPELQASARGVYFKQFDDGSAGIPFIVIWLIIGAIFFTLKMRFVNLRGFTQSIRIASGKYDNPKDPGEVTHFQALTAALSGTVGLGNIAGVALAISIGGPGATFWMILVGLFGMTSKFTECTLGVKYRKIDKNGVVSGGPMYYLSEGLARRGMGGFGRVLAVLFAVLCIGAAFGAGNMFQVNQATEQFMSVMVPVLFGENSFLAGKSWAIGLLYAVFVGLVIIGGIRSITRVTERLVPLMAFIYCTAAIIVIALHIDQIPNAFALILKGAFAPESVAGGFIGVLIQGLRRGTFSNEAGVGSAAIAHSAAKTNEPVAEGLVALLEPFIDTVVICTMTALVIIVTGMYDSSAGLDGISLTSNAFETVIGWFPIVLSLAVLLFAFSTSITWYYYGERAFLYLVGQDRRRAQNGFKLAFLTVLVIGSSMQLTSVMDFADAMLLAMAFPNIFGLYIMSGEVKGMMQDYFGRIRSGALRPYGEAADQPAE